MKRFTLAAVLALGLLAAAGDVRAAGFGNNCGTYGISPGSFSIGLGFNVAWSGMSFGQMSPGGCGAAPCYGPQMYNAYGSGGYADPGYGYGYGYGGYNGYQGGYGAYNGYQGGYNYAPQANTGQAAPAAPAAPANPGK